MAEWLRRQLRRLLVLPFPPDDISEHERALSDIPEPVLTAAVDYALKTRTRYPVPSELRMDVDHVRPQAEPPAPQEDRSIELAQPFTITVPEVGTILSVTREWRYYCEDCSDLGWMSFWCGEVTVQVDGQAQIVPGYKPWMVLGKCQRDGKHYAHEYVQHCRCYESNPALIRKREAQRKYSEAPQKVA